MHFDFELSNTLKGNNYKQVFQYLCEISDEIYFTSDTSSVYNERVYDLCGQCKQIKDISKKKMNQVSGGESGSVLGFKIDIFIKLFIYEFESISQLLGNRGFGSIIFYKEQDETAYVVIDDFKDVYITTNDKKLLEILSLIVSDKLYPVHFRK